jgi:hypothetical protein
LLVFVAHVVYCIIGISTEFFFSLQKSAGVMDQPNGAPAAIRTRDPLLRRQMLYPTELRAQPENQALGSAVFRTP